MEEVNGVNPLPYSKNCLKIWIAVQAAAEYATE